MFKRITVAIGALLVAVHALAVNQNSAGIHSPKFKADIYDRLRQQVTDHRTNPCETSAAIAKSALKAPWTATLNTGLTLSKELGISDPNQAKCVSVLTTMALSPWAATTSVALATTRGARSFLEGLSQRIRAKINEPEFNREMTLHLYQWIETIKEIRGEFRKAIQQWQSENQNDSIKDAIEGLLAGEGFNYYFGDTDLSEFNATEVLNEILPGQDNWENFFPALSENLKTPDLTDNQWEILEKGLRGYTGDKTDFPKISEQDIAEYLNVAIYVFTLNQEHLELLKEHIQYLARY